MQSDDVFKLRSPDNINKQLLELTTDRHDFSGDTFAVLRPKSAFLAASFARRSTTIIRRGWRAPSTIKQFYQRENGK